MRPRLRLMAAVALAALLLALASLAATSRGSSRATSDHGPEGTAALAGVFSRLGREVVPLRLGLHVLPRTPGALLVLVSPPGLVAWPPWTDADADQVISWAERGGVALHLTDRQDPILDALGLVLTPDARPRATLAGASSALPTRPASWTQGGPLSVRGRAGFTDGVGEPLFVADDVVVVSLHRVGEGAVLAVADPSLVSNAALGTPGNLALAVSAATHADGAVLFDDVHAGGGDDRGVIAYARRAGGGGALLLGALGLVLLLWRLGARAVPARPALPPAHTGGAADYVRGLASLYERAELGRHALAVTSRQFRRAVEARAGGHWERDGLDAWLAAELGPEAAAQFHAVRAAFAALFAQERPSPPDVLAAAHLAARFENRWLLRSPARGTR